MGIRKSLVYASIIAGSLAACAPKSSEQPPPQAIYVDGQNQAEALNQEYAAILTWLNDMIRNIGVNYTSVGNISFELLNTGEVTEEYFKGELQPFLSRVIEYLWGNPDLKSIGSPVFMQPASHRVVLLNRETEKELLDKDGNITYTRIGEAANNVADDEVVSIINLMANPEIVEDGLLSQDDFIKMALATALCKSHIPNDGPDERWQCESFAMSVVLGLRGDSFGDASGLMQQMPAERKPVIVPEVFRHFERAPQLQG